MRTLSRLSFAAVTLGCVYTVVFAQQPPAPAPGQPAPSARRSRPGHPGRSRPEHEPRLRCQWQPAPAGAEDRPRLELRRGQGRQLHASGSAEDVGREAGGRCEDLGEAARRDLAVVRDADLRTDAGEHAEGQLAGRRDRSESPRGRGGAEEGRGHDRNEPGRPEDHRDGDDAGEREEARAADPAGEFRRRSAAAPGTTARGPAFNPHSDPPAAADILARGWGYATVGYGDIQPDRANTAGEGVMA